MLYSQQMFNKSEYLGSDISIKTNQYGQTTISLIEPLGIIVCTAYIDNKITLKRIFILIVPNFMNTIVGYEY
jgi:hypothetical protein